ncbi:AFR445Cp [Eremothecium gossypii ATCC 10895]|uniref:Peptidyl-tRNA hydrolase n=1 Tax=Eremothecium gossypii (strain ATCC 10895 / CBS 109.51 / FGSC 9923 / NRRL Y-1056) TaxID=284811 RepID=Q752X8_EREGS|nr:AFR445Cp [Eremothecium gossypii ATCC 10895]AAS53816.1 AFR445Cp [Eremothecium gossypii ATCC 10895]
MLASKARSAPQRRTLHLCLTGLGNPEPQYRNTRHNAGLILLDLLKAHYAPGKPWMPCTVPRVAASYCHASRHDLLLLRSDGAFMNRSGQNVVPLWQRIGGATRVVVHDELSLPLGKVQLRAPGRSPRGHNGLKSIIAAGAQGTYYSLAVGIDRPETRKPAAIADYVLSRFSRAELSQLEQDALPAALGHLNGLLGVVVT